MRDDETGHIVTDLASFIKHRGYKLYEVAEATQIPTRTLNDYCRGRTAIPRHRREALATFLECPVSLLLDETHQGAPPRGEKGAGATQTPSTRERGEHSGATPYVTEASEDAGPLLAETRHLLGRQEWLASVIAQLQAEIPKKLLVLHGPIGVGKSSELNRLAHAFMQQNASQVMVLSLPAREPRDPEASLDLFVGMLLSSSRAAPFPADASRQTRIRLALTALAERPQPTVILLDNAEGTLTDEGSLAPCWEAFLTSVVRGQHRATLILASKEWPGWPGRDSQLVAEIAVPSLTLEESVLLLQRLGLEIVPHAALETTSQRVACIPLCLEWIATIVHDPLVHDAWEGFEGQEETSSESHLNAISQRLARLLEHPTLLGEHLASRLTPLLEHILDRHLSADARRVLEHLAVVSIPLAKPALQVLCPRPTLLKELRNTSLLAAYTNRIQALPTVASTVKARLSPEQLYELEERMIEALTRWVEDGKVRDDEAGGVVTELISFQLRHHHLWDAAQWLIQYGWLCFKMGNAQRLASLAEQTMQQVNWQDSFQTWCGGTLLHYNLQSFLGKKFRVQQRLHDYLMIRNAIFNGTILATPNTLLAITNYLIGYAMDDLCFDKAWTELESVDHYFKKLHISHVDLSVSLLTKRALVQSIWCSYLEEQQETQAVRTLREQAITLYRQAIDMVDTADEPSPLKRAKMKKRQAYALNYLGYHLYRAGHYEDALQVLHRSLTLQEEGYGAFDGLPPCYADLSQTLAALGRFREALYFEEKAYTEAQRLAETGHTSSKRELWIYRINRGCLYLRLGRIQEAESLLREALPHIALHRRMYRMFAEEALREIEQWRRAAISPQYQLDWRWVERYRTLVSFDSYWWLTPSGPLTDEEQQEWDQHFTSTIDDATKAHLGALIARATRREIRMALEESREPRFYYPTLNIEEVHSRITDLRHLEKEIDTSEPNALVRSLYHDTIEEELDFLYLIQATHEKKTEQFWEHNLRLNPLPTREEMQYVLSCIRYYVLQGLRHQSTKEATEHFLHISERCGLSFHLSMTPEEEKALPDIIPLTPSAKQKRMISVQAAKKFFEAVFQQTYFENWQVAIDPNADDARVEQGLRCLFLANRSYTVKTIKDLLSHELAGHVARCVAGEHSLLGLLGIHTKNSLETEEGLAMYYEIQEARREGGNADTTGLWFGTLATGLASGIITPPQTFRSLFLFFEAFLLVYRLLVRPDQDAQVAQKQAHRLARERCLRTFRGVPDLTSAGICYSKDAHYLRGMWKIEQALAKDPSVLDHLAVGVVAIDRLPELWELGIVQSPQSLRRLAEDPQLETYILSFESGEEPRV